MAEQDVITSSLRICKLLLQCGTKVSSCCFYNSGEKIHDAIVKREGGSADLGGALFFFAVVVLGRRYRLDMGNNLSQQPEKGCLSKH